MTITSAKSSGATEIGHRRLFQAPARFVLRLMGWRIIGHLPDLPRFVMIGAPHTSNWDGILLILVTTILRVKIHFLMKDSMFRGMMGPFARWVGGIPIDRSASHNTVDQIAAAFQGYDRLIIAIAPEGTRKKTSYWHSGFYHIAMKANVPILLAFVDYPRKECGFGPLLTPSGDIEADMDIIRAFYADKGPCHPEKAGPIALKPAAE